MCFGSPLRGYKKFHSEVFFHDKILDSAYSSAVVEVIQEIPPPVALSRIF